MNEKQVIFYRATSQSEVNKTKKIKKIVNFVKKLLDPSWGPLWTNLDGVWSLIFAFVPALIGCVSRLLYISTSCAPPKLVKIFIFSKKSWKMRKKQEICSKIYEKTCFYLWNTGLIMSFSNLLFHSFLYLNSCFTLENCCVSQTSVSISISCHFSCYFCCW